MKKDFMFIKPFNKNYKVMTLVYLLLGVVTCLYVSKLDDFNSVKFLFRYSLFLLVYVLIYRTYLLFDKAYNTIVYNKPRSDFFNELLLFPCNICCFVFFLGLFLKSRVLINYTFYVSFAAIAALFFPSRGCDEGYFYEPRIWCFYTTHYLLIFSPILLILSDLYIPTYKDALIAILFYELISFVVFFINIFLRKTGLNPKANYFFNMCADGNPVLEIFYKIIPIPYLCTFIPALVFLGIFELITFITRLIIL